MTFCRRPTIGFCGRREHYESDAHRRNSLFHIATNLVRDARRRPFMSQLSETLERTTD